MISPNIVWVIKSRRMSWVGHVACMGRRGLYRVLMGKCEGSPRHKWEDNIKMDIEEWD